MRDLIALVEAAQFPEPAIMNNDGGPRHAKCFWWNGDPNLKPVNPWDDDDAYIVAWKNRDGDLVLQSMKSNSVVRGRDMLKWLNRRFPDMSIRVVEAIPEADGFWDKMQDEGLVYTVDGAGGEEAERDPEYRPVKWDIGVTESILYDMPDSGGLRGMGYWYNARTNEAVPVTWGYDKGRDDGNHHVDVIMARGKRSKFFGPAQQKFIRSYLHEGLDMETCWALCLESDFGWCRVTVGNGGVKKKGALGIYIDAYSVKDARQTLRWAREQYPAIEQAQIEIWSGSVIDETIKTDSHGLTGRAIDLFLKHGSLTPSALVESHTSEVETLPSVQQIEALRPQMAAAAQKQYDAWHQDEDGYDDELGSGGICHLIADDIASLLGRHGIEAYTVTRSDVQHVHLIAPFREGIYEIDVPYWLYEQGGGFTWRKLPDITFQPDWVVIDRIDRDPANLHLYVGED